METRSTSSYIKVAAAVPEVRVADCSFNTAQIKELIFDAEDKGVQIVCFPELSVTSYTCGDLFLQDALLNDAEGSIKSLLRDTQDLSVCFVIGAPIRHNSKLYNCAVVCHRGKVLGIVPKQYLPNYQEFYEKRWFEPYISDKIIDLCFLTEGESVPFGRNILFGESNRKFAIEVCEDVWSVIPPGSYHSQAGAHFVFNLSASDELIGKQQYVKSLLAQQSARCLGGYIYASAGFGESTTDLVYAGNAYVYENGKLLAEAERFSMKGQLIISELDIDLIKSERRKNTTFLSTVGSVDYKVIPLSLSGKDVELTRHINPTPFVPSSHDYQETCEEIFSIQVMALAKRILHTRTQSLVIGISGGLDSTLALLVCAKTVDKLGMPREMIHGVTMPGFGTTGRTYTNGNRLMKALGITTREIDIKEASLLHFRDIGHDPDRHDVVFENTQARERTQVLMNLANQLNGLVVGTGDMSELALGWATYNGDHMSMYGVNAGIPKTLVRHLVKWVANTQVDESVRETLLDIVDTPVSPELLPVNETGDTTQFTEDLVGPYELHDFFLFYLLRYGFTPGKIYSMAIIAFRDIYNKETVLRWMRVFYRRFFSQQFKRSCMPDGPKVGSVNLSPRGDWRMPSDASVDSWMKEIEQLENR